MHYGFGARPFPADLFILSVASLVFTQESLDFRKIAKDYQKIIESVMNECVIKMIRRELQ